MVYPKTRQQHNMINGKTKNIHSNLQNVYIVSKFTGIQLPLALCTRVKPF